MRTGETDTQRLKERETEKHTQTEINQLKIFCQTVCKTSVLLVQDLELSSLVVYIGQLSDFILFNNMSSFYL